MVQVIGERDGWNAGLLALPYAHILQSWEWGEFKRRWGWQVERLAWTEAGRTVAAAQVLHRPIPGTPWSFLYVPRGPALDYADSALAGRILADLESYTHRQRALFVKIDPDVARQYGGPDEAACPEPAGQTLLSLLARRGWRFSPEQIQFRNTVLLDLAAGPEQLLAAMKSKWRYNIRLAERKGVVIRAGTAADLAGFYQMYAETAARDGFLIRPEAYYRDVWQCFLETGRAELLLASVEGDVVAGLILFIFGRTAWYMYGASTARQRQAMPNHLLQWAAIRRAAERGCTCYDMWGAPDVFDPADRMWGVYQFKLGFGGRVKQGLGAFDYPAGRTRYWLFTLALPRLRAMLRRFRRGSAAEIA